MTYPYQPELDIFLEAKLAAEQATRRYLKDHPGEWYPCGFSSVKIRPARGRFVAMCKQQEVGRTDGFEGGYVIYNPSGNPTQCMEAKIAGSRAFVEVLAKFGIKASAQSRID